MPEDDKNHMMDFLAESALAEHSSQGHGYLQHAALHFLITRLTHEQLATDQLTLDRIEELTHEAWAVFVESSLVSYHTWLAEVEGAPDADMLDIILMQSRTDFQEVADQLIEQITAYGIL